MVRGATLFWLGVFAGASTFLVSRAAAAEESNGEEPKAGDESPRDAGTQDPSAPATEAHWYDAIELRAFADAYVALNFGFPSPRDASAGPGQSSFRAFDTSTGFALHWVGLDLEYAPAPFGATLGLRFGPSASIAAGSDADHGLANVKQALVRWMPAGKSEDLTIDFGKFDTPYGAEVADTQDDLNYTRGIVYAYAQPVFHTGFRATWVPVEGLTLRALLVNGWNDSVDDNAGKTGGAQLVWSPGSAFSVALGYLFGPEQPSARDITCAPGTRLDGSACVVDPQSPGDQATLETKGVDGRFRHLVDLIVDASPASEWRVVLNADFGAEDFGVDGYALGYGVSAATRLAPIQLLGLGVRGEAYRDASGRNTGVGDPITFFTGTLTLDLTPSKYFTTKLDLRLDGATARVFAAGEHLSSHQLTMTLGAVVKTE